MTVPHPDHASPLHHRTRIAVDMDGVLTESPTPLAHAANAQFGLELPDMAFVDSSGLNVPDHVREWVYRSDGPASRLQPAIGAQQFFQRLIDLLGDENVLVVTARPESSADMTLRWFHQHGFPKAPIIFADDKIAVAKRQGCSLAIEDSLRHARNYSAGDLTCFLINNVESMQDGGIAGVVELDSFDDIVEAVRARFSRTEFLESPVVSALPPIRTDSDERYRIVIADKVHDVARHTFEQVAEVVDVNGTDVEALKTAVADADALVVRSETQVTEEVLAAAPRLKVVSRAGVGIDNIDVDAATKAGVVVLNAPGTNAVSAGEHAIALLLAVTRQIPFANRTTHEGAWQRKAIKPIDLRGKTLGMVGIGRVGSIVAKRLQAFEMNVIAYDPYLPRDRFPEIGVEPVELEEVWTRADVITFHCPSTPENHHLLNAETIAKLKPSAIVINAARGELVDEFALADALREGRILGAGIDVYPVEPCKESPLFGLDNAVLTPHTGGSSAEALLAVGRVIGATTVDVLRGESVPNAVNMPASQLESSSLAALTSVATAAGTLLSVLSPERPATMTVEARGIVSNDVANNVMNIALSSALQGWLKRRVTPVNARLIAKELGITVQATADEGDEFSITQFRFEIEGGSDHSVVVSWDRDLAGIVEVDRFSLQTPLEGYVLITHHSDRPGIISRLSGALAEHNINIAGMQVSRNAPRAEALMVTNVDEEIPSDVLEQIRSIDGMEDAFVVSLPSMLASADPVQQSGLSNPARPVNP